MHDVRFHDNNFQAYIRLKIGRMTPTVACSPDLLLVLQNKCFYILELTVGFESNTRKNSHRKHTKYHDLIKQQVRLFTEVMSTYLSAL